MNAKTRILVVDDEQSMRQLLEISLERDGSAVTAVDSAEKALNELGENVFDIVVQDIRMPGMDGVSLLKLIQDRTPETPVIMMTAYSTRETAMNAMRFGARDYIEKPFDVEELKLRIRNILEKRDVMRRDGGDDLSGFGVIGKSSVMRRVVDMIRTVAGTDNTVLITGESGSGKEVVAKAIHYSSNRSAQPFIAINCGAFTENLLSSELFGHKRGAFTGAVAEKKGFFEIARGGTLLLDEIGEMSLEMQVSLLRVLENKEYIPVGGTTPVKTNVRILVATNRNIEQLVKERLFREDLYYRINVMRIPLPPLRERSEDIPLLAGYFLSEHSKRTHSPVKHISAEVMDTLMKYPWPGNVRELSNRIQSAIVMSGDRDIETGVLFPEKNVEPESRIPENGIDLEQHLRDMEKEYIREALEKTGGNITNAAQLLHYSFRSLRYKIKKYKIEL